MSALLLTWRGAWAEAVANPRGFWSQVGIMAANNTVWIAFWIIFFGRVGSVRGWDADSVMVLLAVSSTSVGLAIGALANSRWIGHLATGNELDAALALPVSPLPYLLCRRVEPANVGDIAFGVVLFAVLGHPDPQRLVLFGFGVLCATVVLTGFLVIVGSLVFWTGPNPASDLGFQAVLLFSMYPVDVFGSAVRLLLYGVVPGALVAAVPTRLIERFQWPTAAALAGAALVFGVVAWVVFHRGLRRYTSGSTWTDA